MMLKVEYCIFQLKYKTQNKTIKTLKVTANSTIIFYSKRWRNAFFQIVFFFVCYSFVFIFTVISIKWNEFFFFKVETRYRINNVNKCFLCDLEATVT